MNKNQKIITILVSIAIFGIIFPTLTGYSGHSYNQASTQPVSAADQITSDDVTIDRSTIKRVLQSVNITFNNSHLLSSPGFNANITFADDSSLLLPMANTTSNPQVWSVLFTPDAYNITGQANVYIQGTSGGIENNDPDASFIIENNKPSVSVQLDKEEYYREETINMEFFPSDVEQAVGDLTWMISLYRSGSATPIEIFVNNESVFEYSYDIANDTALGNYYINATCWDADERNVDLYYFEILNNDPIIDAIQLEIGESIYNQVNSTSIPVYRGENFKLRLNASDIDGHFENFRITITAKDPISGTAIFFSDYNDILPNLTETSWLFEKEVLFPTTINIGVITMNVELREYATDNETLIGKSSETIEIQLKNNAPEVNKFYINGFYGEPLSFTQNEVLNFTFDVIDDEDASIIALNHENNKEVYAYITIILTHDATGTQKQYTIPYQYSETEKFQLNTAELAAGTWTVQILIQDTDGLTSELSDPVKFEIETTKTFNSMIWLMFVIGIIIGGVLVFATSYTGLKIRLMQKSQISEVESDTESSDNIEVDKTPSKVEKPESKPKSKKNKKLVRKL
ncbi:MAG: hypothetical protein K9W44_02100 [Candidatus Lokiarchaeota archaeon]|nr:hypothetical protein [Candidatus Harpocratesius repetitus]